MERLYERAGRITAQNGGLRPGQFDEDFLASAAPELKADFHTPRVFEHLATEALASGGMAKPYVFLGDSRRGRMKSFSCPPVCFV